MQTAVRCIPKTFIEDIMNKPIDCRADDEAQFSALASLPSTAPDGPTDKERDLLNRLRKINDIVVSYLKPDGVNITAAMGRIIEVVDDGSPRNPLLPDNIQSSTPVLQSAALDNARKQFKDQAVEWAVGEWKTQVRDRPLENVHRRSLDSMWRQVIWHFGGDALKLIGPRHDVLLAEIKTHGQHDSAALAAQIIAAQAQKPVADGIANMVQNMRPMDAVEAQAARDVLQQLVVPVAQRPVMRVRVQHRDGEVLDPRIEDIYRVIVHGYGEPIISDAQLQCVLQVYDDALDKAREGRVFDNPGRPGSLEARAWDVGTRRGKELGPISQPAASAEPPL